MQNYAYAYVNKDFYLTNLIYATGADKKERLKVMISKFGIKNTRSRDSYNDAMYIIAIPINDHSRREKEELNKIYSVICDGLQHGLGHDSVNCMIAQQNGVHPKMFPDKFKISPDMVAYHQKQVKAKYGMSLKEALKGIILKYLFLFKEEVILVPVLISLNPTYVQLTLFSAAA